MEQKTQKCLKFTLIALTACLLLLTYGCERNEVKGPASAGLGIVGFWTRSGGDYSLTNEYRDDGMLVQHIDGKAGTPRPYRIQGDLIIVSVPQEDGRIFDFTNQFALAGEELIFFDSPTDKSDTRVFKRDRKR